MAFLFIFLSNKSHKNIFCCHGTDCFLKNIPNNNCWKFCKFNGITTLNSSVIVTLVCSRTDQKAQNKIYVRKYLVGAGGTQVKCYESCLAQNMHKSLFLSDPQLLQRNRCLWNETLNFGCKKNTLWDKNSKRITLRICKGWLIVSRKWTADLMHLSILTIIHSTSHYRKVSY